MTQLIMLPYNSQSVHTPVAPVTQFSPSPNSHNHRTSFTNLPTQQNLAVFPTNYVVGKSICHVEIIRDNAVQNWTGIVFYYISTLPLMHMGNQHNP